MDRMTTDGVGLAYEVRGHGEPVVLIHAGVCADFFAPLMDEPALSRYRVGPSPLRRSAITEPATNGRPSTPGCAGCADPTIAARWTAGGNVATLYAARHPDRVAHRVLVAPGCGSGRS